MVLDLVTHDVVIDEWSELAERTGAGYFVIECFCEDADVHRDRVEKRERDIPGWYELTWERVQRSRELYRPLRYGPKLVLSAHDPIDINAAKALAHIETAASA